MSGLQLAVTQPFQGFLGPSLGRPHRSGISVFMMEADRAVPAQDNAILVDLMAAVAGNRDREAFARLFDHFAPRVKAYIRRLGAEPAAAEDLVQDVMLTVWRRAGQFDPSKAGVATWVFTITRNRRIDVIRRERRPEPDPNDPALVPDREPEADAALAQKQDGARLRRAVAELPDEQARLLQLAYFEDKSQTVIADELDLPLGTVKSRIRLAMTKLRVQLVELE